MVDEQMQDDREGATQATLEQAWIDFQKAFQAGLTPGELDRDAVTYPRQLFTRTVEHAIHKGLEWRKGEEPADFALRQVQYIAAEAKFDAQEDHVALRHLQPIEKKVVRFYKKRCKLWVGETRAARAVFCVLYNDNGDWDAAAGQPEGEVTRKAPDSSPCVDDIESDAPEVAFVHFRDRFLQHCFPSRLGNGAEESLVVIFDRTVRPAIQSGEVKWKPGDACTEFALNRVAEIAVVAKHEAPGMHIPGWVIDAAARRVVEYWRPICGLRAVFCVDYPL